MINLELSKENINLIVHCINTNATLESHIKEKLLVEIRKFINDT